VAGGGRGVFLVWLRPHEPAHALAARRSGLRSGHSPWTTLVIRSATTASRRLILVSFHRPRLPTTSNWASEVASQGHAAMHALQPMHLV
jgi:hypothetical protein